MCPLIVALLFLNPLLRESTVLKLISKLICTYLDTPHELSKIRNLREVPLPTKRLQLPDIPLPSAKYMFKSPYRGGVQRVDEGCQTIESSFEGFTPASTPRLMSEESEALR